MHDHAPKRTAEELSKLRYEPETMNIGGVVKTVAGFMIFVGLAAPMGAFAFWVLNRDAFSQRPPEAAFVKHVPPAPNPLLQTNATAKADIMTLRQHEREVLEGYGKIDPEHVRIPISRAMDIVISKNMIPSQAHSGVVIDGGQN